MVQVEVRKQFFCENIATSSVISSSSATKSPMHDTCHKQRELTENSDCFQQL